MYFPATQRQFKVSHELLIKYVYYEKFIDCIFSIADIQPGHFPNNLNIRNCRHDNQEVKVKVGGDFALQFQALNHEAPVELLDLKNNFNLPTANLNITADLAPGVRLFINNYMSSRHHNEAWVEGGYLTLSTGCRFYRQVRQDDAVPDNQGRCYDARLWRCTLFPEQ